MAVDPSGKDLKRLLEEDPGGPVVMLNLLRFKPDGKASYQAYLGALEETFLPRCGGRVVYVGEGSTAVIAEPGQSWDMVLMVEYPSRRAFSAMVADPDYQRVTHLRTEALLEAVLQATVP